MANADWPVAVRVGELVWVGSLDPEAGFEIEHQCEAVYRSLIAAASALRDGDHENIQVVRLEHWTQSQSWLARRQAVRAAYFGRPAPLASAGIPSWLRAGQWLRLSGIAQSSRTAASVLVDGQCFDMPAIATAVAARPFVLFSGILAEPHYELGRLMPPDSSGLSFALEALTEALEAAGSRPSQLRRIEAYIADSFDSDMVRETIRRKLGVGLHYVEVSYGNFEGPGAIELVAIASDRDEVASGYWFSPIVSANEVGFALEELLKHGEPLLARGLQFVRLDVVCTGDVRDILFQKFRESDAGQLPVLVHKPLRPSGGNISLSAILADPTRFQREA